MSVTQADGSYIDSFTAVPLYLSLCRNLQSYSSGVSETVHVGCCVLCHVLPHLTSDVVLSMDWLHAINPWINWKAYLLSLDCKDKILYILGTK